MSTRCASVAANTRKARIYDIKEALYMESCRVAADHAKGRSIDMYDYFRGCPIGRYDANAHTKWAYAHMATAMEQYEIAKGWYEDPFAKIAARPKRDPQLYPVYLKNGKRVMRDIVTALTLLESGEADKIWDRESKTYVYS